MGYGIFKKLEGRRYELEVPDQYRDLRTYASQLLNLYSEHSTQNSRLNHGLLKKFVMHNQPAIMLLFYLIPFFSLVSSAIFFLGNFRVGIISDARIYSFIAKS